MADVAKSAVRADRDAAGGGDEGGEEEESSLSAAIESELRGVLGKSWSSGWTTVEEVLAATPPLANGHAQPLTQPLTNGHDLKPTHDLAPSPQQIVHPFEHSLETSGTDQSSQALSVSSAQDTAEVIPQASTLDSADQLHEATISDPSDQSPQAPHPNLPLTSTQDHSDHPHLTSSPDLSHLPVHTSTPDHPDLPVQNSTPDYPERPLQASTPEQFQQTSDPGHPDFSVHKSTPGHPNLPLQTTTPDHPERPLQTSTPDDPENTSTPDRPEPPLQMLTPDDPQKASPHDHSDHPQPTSPPDHLDQFLLTSRPEESPRAGSLDPAPKVVSPDCPPSPLREDSLTDHSPLSDLPLTNGTQEVLHEEVRTCIESVLVEFSQEATDGTEKTEITESTVIDKKKKKKTVVNGEDTEEVTTTKKKTKKSKKTEGKENISVKSSFSKFDQLSKKTVLHVRSSDPAKAQKTFSQGAPDAQAAVLCKACQKQVFAMEQIKAERAVWHKNCFRCHTCNKQLTVDIYQSHEGLLYCKPHFRDLFQPKAVVDEEEPASDKPDLGLEELSSLNVKSKFQVFERQTDQPDCELERSPTTVSVKRSSSIMSKLAKFQKKGMDVGVTDESLNGFVYEETSSSEEESEEEEEEDKGVIKCRRKARERPVSFGKMNDVKKNWESLNQSQRREEMREERKLELQQIRSRMWQGKQGKMKELYEQAVAESEQKGGRRESLREDEELGSLSENAKLARERFEKGEVGSGEGHESSKKELDEDMAVFEEGISKKSRNIFKEMEAAAKAGPLSPTSQPQPVARTESVRRPRETDSPEREVYRDPDVVRCDEKSEEESTILRSQTASRMLSVFRQLEEQKEVIPDGPKPKKCFTPPPDYRGSEDSNEEEGSEDEEGSEEEEEEEEESETEEGVVKSSYKVKDDFLEQAKNAARAKQLAAKFEQWEPEKQSTNNAINMLESEHASIESTKSLKARFESLQNEQPKEKSRPKVNRFV